MTDTLQQRFAALRAKRAAYPRFRRDLLWIRDIGLVVDAGLCLGLALLASPTVLTAPPE
ncbi:NADH-ubiquinone oxidoreductase chain 1 [Burkholderiales bacterium GJ-E10]|nr:NADH-ubiquinone oxidoreductase chain 1 [Burkholderiales bacterium GJ-E10]